MLTTINSRFHCRAVHERLFGVHPGLLPPGVRRGHCHTVHVQRYLVHTTSLLLDSLQTRARANSAIAAFFGFLLGFYTNPWVQKDGYIGAFGAMGGIQAAVLLGFVPFYLFGSRWRTMSWKWPFIRRIAHWAEDREVGE